MTSNNDTIYIEIVRDPELRKNLKDLVTARIQGMPSDVELAIGSQQFSKEELLEHLHLGDELAEEIMETELEFLQDLARGDILKYE